MNKNQNNKNQQSLSWTALLKENEEQFTHKVNSLRRMIKIWHQLQKKPDQPNVCLSKYAFYIEEFYDNIGLEEHFELSSIKYDEELKKIKSEKQIYLRSNCINSSMWKINFNHRFICQLSNCRCSIYDVFVLMHIFAQGFLPFYGNSDICLKRIEYFNSQRKYYLVPINDKSERYSLIISIGVCKIPIFTYKATALKQFQFQSFIQCQSIFPSQVVDKNFIVNTLKDIQSINQFNPKFDFKKEQLVILKQKNKQNVIYYGNDRNRQSSNIISKIYPYTYKPQLADQFGSQNYEYLMKRWKFHHNKEIYLEGSLQNEQNNQENIHQSYSLKSKRQMERKQQTQFTWASKIIEVLKLSPSFKHRLTNQQRQVLSKDGNLIVVGRSGTGKTTCALYRLYGIQFILKKRQINRIIDSNQQKKKCQMMLFQEVQFSKNIFLTFSPILIQTIKQQYNDILFQIKKKHAKKCISCKNNQRTLQQQLIENDPIDKIKKQLEQQQQKVKSLNLLNKKEFPAFFTISNFIRVIDKTIQRPFYNHQLERANKNIQLDIIRSYINNYEYTAQQINNRSTIYAVYVDFSFFQKHIWPQLPKQISKVSKEFSLLTPAVVWSQIFSIIKGSIKSFTFPEGYISLKMYLDEKRNVFQNFEEAKIIQLKTKVYNIFKVYQNWCKQEEAYDLMDVVNHLLRQIELFGYSGPKMNYVFIDEVQDLTTATIFLLSKLVLNNIFYCGDTAQAITKGVDFRFQDIKYIFNKNCFANALQISPPSDPIILSINFRSHNRILQLANSIISTIEEIFPKAIKKSQIKQQSDLFGPKPFIILGRIDQLLDLICGPKVTALNQAQILPQNIQDEYYKDQIKQGKQYRQFNHQQIIIVRNIQQKNKLPSILAESIILTPQTAKGLQYEEVILYNFFSSCPCIQKWSILDNLLIQEQIENQNEFEKKLSRRSKEQTGIQQELTKEIKKLLDYSDVLKGYNIRRVKIKPSIKEIDLNLYFELITQLKMLYTIITRACSVFVIYDTQIPRSLIRLWREMNLITFIDDQNLKMNRRDIEQYTKRQRQAKYLNTVELWTNQGGIMLQRKQYQNAKNCFRRINRIDLIQRIEAMELIIKAENQSFEWNNENKKISNLRKADKIIKNIQLNKIKQSYMLKYRSAANIFQNYKRYEQAANAYQKCQDFLKALQCYIILKNQQKTALCYFTLKQYANALKIYQKIGPKQKIIQCYILGQLWIQLFKMIYQSFQSKQKNILIPKNLIKRCIYSVLHKIIDDCKINQKQINREETISLNQIKYKKQDLINQICRINEQNCYLNYKNLLLKINQRILPYLNQKRSQNQEKIKLQQILNQITGVQSKNYNIKYRKKLIQKQNNQNQKLLSHLNTKRIFSSQLSVNQISNVNLLQSQIGIYSQYDKKFSILDQKIFQEIHVKISVNSKKNLQLSQEQHKNQIQIKKLIKTKGNLIIQLQKIKNKKINIQNKLLSKLQKIKYKIFYNNVIVNLQKNGQKRQNQIIEEKYNQYKLQNYGINYDIGVIGRYITYLNQVVDVKTTKNQIANKTNSNNGKKYRQKVDIVKSSIQNTNATKQEDEILNLDNTVELIKFQKNNQKSSIFKNHLFSVTNDQLICRIKSIINDSLKFCQYQADKFCQNTHHQYIQQKLYRKHKQQQQLSQILNLYRRCDFIEHSLCNLILCDYSKQTIDLSLKHILGYTLEFSRVYKQNRFVKNQQKDTSLKTLHDLKIMHNFILNIDNEVLAYKIPRVGLANDFYYRSLINDLVTGLILQGHFKEAIIFCEPDISCRVAYLCSSYELFIKQIKEIAEYKNIRIPQLESNLAYVFINEQNMPKFPEAHMINIISTQEIFYAHDKYKEAPFLRIKQLANDIQIQQQIIEQQINSIVESRQHELQKYKQQLNNQIKHHEFELRYLNIDYNSFLQQARQYLINYQIKSLNFGSQIIKLKQFKNQIQRKYNIAQRQVNLSQNQYNSSKQRRQQFQRKVTSMKLQKRNLDFKFRINQSLRQQQQQLAIIKYQRQEKQKQSKYEMTKKQKLKINDQLQSITKSIKQNQQYLGFYKSKISQIENRKLPYTSSIKIVTQKINQIKSKLSNSSTNDLELQICRKLIAKQKLQRYNKQFDKTMNQIANKSNISNNNKFLQYYLFKDNRFKDNYFELSFQQIYQEYSNIMRDGIYIHQIQSNQITEKICNIIIFYLSFLFDQSFKKQVFQVISADQNSESYKKLHKNIQRTIKDFNYVSNELQYHKNSLFKRQIQQMNVDRQQYLQQLNAFQYEKVSHPAFLLPMFLQKLTKAIQRQQEENNNFIQILFGFFQCRIIKNCAPLDCLSNEYILIRSNSIVMQQLRKQVNHFCYYFDDENKIAICLFLDVRRIIINLIKKQLKQINMMNITLDAQINKSNNHKKYINDQEREINLFLYKDQEEERIMYLIDQHYINLSEIAKIKNIKRSVIEFYYENSVGNKQSFHFVLHQLNEYQFLEQMYLKMEYFNPQQLTQMESKFKKLQNQFKKWATLVKTETKFY